MSSTLWRRVFLAVYMLVMVAASLWIVGRAFAPGSMVQIHDQEAVMRRRTSNVLTSLTISDPCWPDVTITDQDFLFALGQQMSAIPRVSGQFPGEAPGKITGTMIFADGSQEEFAAGTSTTAPRARRSWKGSGPPWRPSCTPSRTWPPSSHPTTM